jgi:hypothetical protein
LHPARTCAAATTGIERRGAAKVDLKSVAADPASVRRVRSTDSASTTTTTGRIIR